MTTLTDLGYVVPEQKSSFVPLEAGTYDAVIHGIVHLGLQPQKNDFVTGKERPPRAKLKIIFEVPDSIRDDGMTALISKDINLSHYEKSDYFKLMVACLGVSNVTEVTVISTPLEDLLGKKLALTVAHWENAETGKSGSKVAENGMNVLDKRLAAIAKSATRPTFTFNPMNPDLEVFNDILTFWTQKTIMEALDAHNYPKELYKAWEKIIKSRAEISNIPPSNNISTEALE